MHETNAANETKKPTDWNIINWQKAYRQVRNLRQRIFRASQAGDFKKVRSLQKLMLKSYSNTLISVRRVTQINTGRNTAGVDKITVKTPAARGKLVDTLMRYQPWRARPAKRVYIPKANNTSRPLGIPTVIDRCIQARVKNAIEPFWEAQFEQSSYGFRPGRSCHDAIQKVYALARPNKRKNWIVDADIKGAFDNIDHNFLVNALNKCPGHELIKQWLKAGYIEQGIYHDTPTGTPQGGVISPLLANIALHGMEKALNIKYSKRGQIVGKRALVKYADDFVVFCESKEDAEAVLLILDSWLKQRGLTFSPEKTKITHLSQGFDFLGFNVRHYNTKKTRTGRKLLIKPSKKAVQKLKTKIRTIWVQARGMSVQALLGKLNPVIRGWANYYRTQVATETFQDLDRWMHHRAIRYAKRTHPNKSMHWRIRRYWGRLNPQRQDKWVFGDPASGHYLLKFGWFHIQRHALVRGAASPDDPTLQEYWRKRATAQVKDLIPSQQKIARQQGYRCPLCRQSLFNQEDLQRHHCLPRRQGGGDEYSNIQLMHRYCHQQHHSSTKEKIHGQK